MLNQDSITFEQFKTWLTQLIVEKKGQVPDVNDWKQIKQMMDKVAPDTAAPTLSDCDYAIYSDQVFPAYHIAVERYEDWTSD